MRKRYKVKRFNSCYSMNWVDNKTNKELTALEIEEILHKQEKRIAELEEENESYQKLINDLCNKHRVGSLKDLDELYQATTESLYASREYLEELKSAKWELEEQLKNAIVLPKELQVGNKVYFIDVEEKYIHKGKIYSITKELNYEENGFIIWVYFTICGSNK